MTDIQIVAIIATIIGHADFTTIDTETAALKQPDAQTINKYIVVARRILSASAT